MAAETLAGAETPAEPKDMEVDSAAATPAGATAETAALAAAEEGVTSGEDSIDEPNFHSFWYLFRVHFPRIFCLSSLLGATCSKLRF